MSIKRDRDEITNDISKKKLHIDIAELICPISKEIFYKPVTTNDGFTYEEWAIKQILDSHNKVSPITREAITSYCENKIAKNLVNNILEQNPELKKDQFSEDIYNDYLQNKKYCVGLLKNKNYGKFSEIKNIHLVDSTNLRHHL